MKTPDLTAASTAILPIVRQDSWLEPYEPVLLARQERLRQRLQEIEQ